MLYKDSAWQEITAALAYSLATARTLSLTGAVTGSVATDLSGDAAIPTNVTNYQHYHRTQWVSAYAVFSSALGGGATYIPWATDSGSSDWGNGHISGTQVLLPKAGWWYVAVYADAIDKTGAGTRTLELWTNSNYFHPFEAMNSDGAGRWGANAQGWVISDGATWCNPYLWWNIANTTHHAWFTGVFLRP